MWKLENNICLQILQTCQRFASNILCQKVGIVFNFSQRNYMYTWVIISFYRVRFTRVRGLNSKPTFVFFSLLLDVF